MATLDLMEAYLLIPIDIEFCKYLRFQYIVPNSSEIITYEVSPMPYRLAISPRCFTKIVREVVAHLRGRGFKSVCYLNDLFCIGSSYEECLRNVKESVALFECLGFVVNYEKSNLQPQKSCKFLE